MKLSLLLWGLAVKLRKASRNNAKLQSLLNARTASIRIGTEDQTVGRLFVFSKGHIFTQSGAKGGADLKMVWKDPDTAYKAMTSADPESVSHALERGDLRLEGDLTVAQWFGHVIRTIKPAGPQTAPIEAVAVIGLGKMGSGLAHNIQQGGFPLTVFNRTAAKAKPFLDKGAILASSPKEAASHADIIVSSLMDDASIRSLVTAPDGVLAGLKPGGIHLCATTISPDMAREMVRLHDDHGCHFVSGAVVGRPDAAMAGELITFLAGEKESLARCMPVCETYSSSVMIMGEEPSLANYAKLSVNYVAVSCMALMGQIYSYGDAVGIAREFYGRLFETSFSNPILKMYAAKIRDQEFETGVGFELSGGLKDVKLMLAASDETSQSFDYAPMIIEKMEQAAAAGFEHSDWSVFTRTAD